MVHPLAVVAVVVAALGIALVHNSNELWYKFLLGSFCVVAIIGLLYHFRGLLYHFHVLLNSAKKKGEGPAQRSYARRQPPRPTASSTRRLTSRGVTDSPRRIGQQMAPRIVPQQVTNAATQPTPVKQMAPRIVPQQVTDAAAQPAPVKQMAPVNAPKKVPSFASAQQRATPTPSPFVEQEVPTAAFDARVIFQNLTYDAAMKDLRRAGCYLIRQCFKQYGNYDNYTVVFDYWIHVPTKTQIRVHDRNKTNYTYSIGKVRKIPLKYDLTTKLLCVNAQLLLSEDNAIEEQTSERTIVPKSSCEEEGTAMRLRQFDCAKQPGTIYLYNLACKYESCRQKIKCMYLHDGEATVKLVDPKCITDTEELFYDELWTLSDKKCFN